MRRAIRLFAAVCLWGATTASLRAALDIDTEVPKSFGLQLVVVEAADCIYCGLFRRDVLPSLAASERAKDLDIRFIDVNDVEAENLELAGGIDMAPTFVLVRDKKEIGRIPGYVGPENFFHLIDYILASSP